MLDNFREWLSDNLRYILLGLAVLLVVVIAFFTIHLITRGSKSDQSQKETNTATVQDGKDSAQTEGDSEAGSMAESETQGETEEDGTTSGTAENPLTKEASDSAIQSLMVKYYTAVAARDYDTLASIDETFDEDAKAAVDAESAIESYNNIVTYTKAGLTEGSYIVYIYYEAKITGIDTLAPSLREKYVVTDADNSLKISDKRSSQELIDYILDMQSDSSVQKLIKDVNQNLEDAKAQDADLASYVDSINNNDPGEVDDTSSSAQTGKMRASTTVNVRGDTSSSATLYGTLVEGKEVEVLETLDNGWSKIRYSYDQTIIEGYVMTQYLEPVNE